MQRKKIASVDQDTGEVLEGVIVYCGVKQNPYGKGWIMTSQDALELLAADDDLTKEAFRVLMFLMARLDFENWIQVTQQEISEKISIKKSNVSRAISLLEKKGIILRGPKVGRSYAFRLNPYFGWKGKVKNLDDYRQKENEAQSKAMLKKAKLSLITPENGTEPET
ncbi:MarR family transcriptional regulator [Aphanothece hegewaldii CCALA 016]|uniref:MarR family transcriptional regulator n=1 Tax=Aphanothece hegewaldii CCALA 016 TaxID=2107694 RepID=A0A2T1LQW4_9CHRO|nr:helix-turn-helix domain-containing protein [Aphanothece hegewaldii]PSF30237.1 MarR family transcriptional regulator [Aphanothece hegewaldii CCALA 016]